MRVLLALLLAAAVEHDRTTVAVPNPGGEGGIGFDDPTFSPTLHRVLVPGGRTGNLDLIDPATKTGRLLLYPDSTPGRR
jgi:hypothetical protein